MPWVMLHIETDEHHCDGIEAALLQCGAATVSLQDCADQPLFDEPGESTRLWRRVKISGMFDAAADVDTIAQQLASQGDLGIANHSQEILEDKDWVRAWMDSYQPMAMGERLWICPSWLAAPDPAAVNLVLDPGMAFGTGTHPTTAMCLRWLDSAELRGKTIVDYGCGSGILAIAALLLGAQSAIATDIDGQAITATRDNARRNGLSEQQLKLCYPGALGSEEPADLLLANILAGPLAQLAPQISSLVKAGGDLVLSGILAQQAEALMTAYPEFDFVQPWHQDGWVMLHGRRRLSPR